MDRRRTDRTLRARDDVLQAVRRIRRSDLGRSAREPGATPEEVFEGCDHSAPAGAARPAPRGASPGRTLRRSPLRRTRDHRARRRRQPAPGRRQRFRRVLSLGGSRGSERRRRLVRRRVLLPREGWLGNERTARPPDARPGARPARALPGPVPARADRDRPAAGRARRVRSPARRSRSATTARSRATCPARAGSRKPPRRRRAAWKGRACERSRGPRPARAYAVGRARGRCGCGAARRACGNTIPPRR